MKYKIIGITFYLVDVFSESYFEGEGKRMGNVEKSP